MDDESATAPRYRIVAGITIVALWGAAIIHAAPYGLIGNDFVQDYAAAVSGASGQSLYGDHIGVIASRAGGWGTNEFNNFHPPFLTLLAMPFIYLPVDQAFIVWNCLQALLIIASVLLLSRRLGLSGRMTVTALCGLPFWAPVVSTFGLGQLNGMLLMLITVSWCLWRSQNLKWRQLAGVPLAAASLIKLFPAYLLILFVLEKNWRALAGFAATFFAGIALSSAAFGIDDVIHYASTIIPRDVAEWGIFPINHSIRGLLQRTFAATPYTTPLISNPEAIPFLWWILCAAVASAAAVVILRANKAQIEQPTRDLVFWSQVIPMFLISPITWQHSLVLTAPLLLLLLTPQLRSHFQTSGLAAITVLFVVDVDLARAAIEQNPSGIPWIISVTTTAFPFWTLVFLAVIISRAICNGQLSESQAESSGHDIQNRAI